VKNGPNSKKWSLGLLSLVPVVILLLIFEYGSMGNEIQAVYYASPDGAGHECSLNSPCSLTGLRDKIRTVNGNMAGDIHAYLRGGTYTLNAPFELTNEDSGTNSHDVIYMAYPGETPTLSGGRQITGWTLYDAARNIYRARVDASFQTRQLFVDGRRAIRAKGDVNPPGFVKTSAGYTLPSSGIYAGMGTWGNRNDIELVGFTNWKSFRCGVDSIRNGTVVLKSTCWSNSQLGSDILGMPAWVENAYELLDSEGEWYWNRTAGDIYYKPRPGENMASAVVIAPATETLLTGTGSAGAPIHNIRFRGITFAYAAWFRPSTDNGYVPAQAGVIYKGRGHSDLMNTPSHLQFRMAHNIILERNTFIHLGGSALTFDRGSQNNKITGNRFEDISSHAIQIGNVNDRGASGEDIVQDNEIRNNSITRIGAEYYDAVGVFIGYAAGTVVDHNEIADVPYSGISVGWGWTDKAYGNLRNNRITNNRIRDFMTVLNDGGGIYTLSRQDDTVISGNYIYNNHRDYGSIYLDLGSHGITVTSNVISDRVTNWVFVQDSVPPYSTGNSIVRNFTDTSKSRIYKNNRVIDNTVIADGQWPQAAAAIMAQAGPEPGYEF
jgi:hypothetical protein